MFSKSLTAALATSVCIMAVATPASAQDRQFDIPAGDLKIALDAFTRQGATPIIYRSADIEGVRSAGYRGAAAPRSVLEALLRGTGFLMRVDSSGAIAVAREGNGAGGEQQSGLDPADVTLSGEGPTTAAGEIVATDTTAMMRRRRPRSSRTRRSNPRRPRLLSTR